MSSALDPTMCVLRHPAQPVRWPSRTGNNSIMPRGELDAKADRRRLCGTAATPDAVAGLYPDPSKSLVMELLGRLVTDGFAEWTICDNGEIELRFSTGETFRLVDKGTTRLA
jgi:hypothetical protein